MALAHSPKVVTDGLVFAYDMGNADKSWKGKPTTNLAPNLGIVNIQAAPTTTYVGVENGWKKYSLNGTWTAGTYPYSIGIDAVAFTGGVTYSSGVYIKTNVPTKFANLFGGMNYVNEPMNNGGTSFSIPQSDGSFFVGRTGFQYTSTTTQTGYILSQPVVGQTFSSATDFIYIKDGQVETGLYTTPFTSGTRSNTQALLDLTKQNTITATSLTYNSNGSFEFAGSGSGNYLDCGNATHLQIATNVTLEAWVKADTSNGAGNIIQKNNNSGYRMRIENQNFWMYAGGNFVVQTDNGCTNNVWHHVVAVFSSTGLRAYVDGVLVASNSTAYNQNPTDGNLQIGTFAGGSELFDGRIDIARVYNRALTAEEILQNFNALRGRFGI